MRSFLTALRSSPTLRVRWTKKDSKLSSKNFERSTFMTFNRLPLRSSRSYAGSVARVSTISLPSIARLTKLIFIVSLQACRNRSIERSKPLNSAQHLCTFILPVNLMLRAASLHFETLRCFPLDLSFALRPIRPISTPRPLYSQPPLTKNTLNELLYRLMLWCGRVEKIGHSRKS